MECRPKGGDALLIEYKKAPRPPTPWQSGRNLRIDSTRIHNLIIESFGEKVKEQCCPIDAQSRERRMCYVFEEGFLP